RRGHEITVVCGNEPRRSGRQLLDGITVDRLRIAGRIYGSPVIPEVPFRLALQNTDVIHANHPSPYGAYFASVISRVRKIPAVLTWHNDLLPVTPVAHMLLLTHDRLVLPLYLPQYRYIIATSKLYARSSPTLIAQKKRVVVIPHGVDTERFNPKVSGDEIRSRLNLGQHKIVLFVGALTRWHRYKRLDILMKAIALLKKEGGETKLMVVGGGELTPEYRHLAERLGIQDRVVFAGDVPDSDLPKFYASSDMLVLPSKDRSEGFGLVILEANATGKPAIGTNVGGIPSAIRDGYNGLLVPPNHPEALAKTIRTALADEERLRRMGQNGRALAERRDWSTVAEKTEEVYERALASH
ncbi:glycosyltransferase family 4 protein, partial [[Eubacterium] cellulosolvens]